MTAGCGCCVWGAASASIQPGVASICSKQYPSVPKEPQSCGGWSLSLLEDKCE